MSRSCFWIVPLFVFLSIVIAAAAEMSELDRAITSYQAEDYEEALAILQPMQVDGADARISYYLGLTLKRMGDNREALRHLQEARRLGSSEPGLYREIAEAALAIDDLGAAEEAVTAGLGNGASRGEMEYLRGLILLRQGDDAAAQTAFEQARAAGGTVAAQAEFQLAQIYARQNRIDQARRSLQAVMSLDPTSDIAAYAADYERQFAQGGRAQDVWRGYARLGYLYDDNAIAVPERDIPGITFPDERDSALTAGLGLEYAPKLAGRKLFNARYDASSVFYAENSSSNQIVQSLTLTPGYGDSYRAVSLPLIYSYSFLDGESYQQLLAVKPTFNQRLGAAGLLQLRGGYSQRDMLIDYADYYNEQLEGRDADIYTVGGGLYRFFAEGQGMTSLRYEWSREATEGRNWENRGQRVSLSILLPLAKTFSADGSVEYYGQRFDNVNSFFGVTRRDDTYTASAGFNWICYDPLRIYSRYQYTRVDSNIAIYDYRRNTVELGLEYRF